MPLLKTELDHWVEVDKIRIFAHGRIESNSAAEDLDKIIVLETFQTTLEGPRIPANWLHNDVIAEIEDEMALKESEK
jgi:hypothetical protein